MWLPIILFDPCCVTHSIHPQALEIAHLACTCGGLGEGASCRAKNVGAPGLLVLGFARASNEVQSPLPACHSFRNLLWVPLADNNN